jgi:hypothetical protein
MATFRGLAPEVYEPFVNHIHFQEFTQQGLMYPSLFKSETTNQAFIDDFSFAGLGRYQLKPEGTNITFDDPVQGDRRRTPILTYALGFRATMEALEDDQHGLVRRMSSDLGGSGRDSQDRLAWDLINDGAAGATYLGPPEGDGTRRALWSTAHVPLKNPAATQSNRVNPGVALSQTGIQAAVTIFRLTQSEEERYVENTPTKLLTHPDEEWNAGEILKSENKVNSADNNVNMVSRLGLGHMQVPYLTDTDAWSLWGDKHQVTWVNRKSLTTTTSVDSQTGDRSTMSHWRSNVYIGGWRGTVGSIP